MLLFDYSTRQLSDSSSNFDSDDSSSWKKTANKKQPKKRPSKLSQFRAKIQGRKTKPVRGIFNKKNLNYKT